MDDDPIVARLRRIKAEVTERELQDFYGPTYAARVTGDEYALHASLSRTPPRRLELALGILRDRYPCPGATEETATWVAFFERIDAVHRAHALNALDRDRFKVGGKDAEWRGRAYGTSGTARGAPRAARAKGSLPPFVERPDAALRRRSNRAVLEMLLRASIGRGVEKILADDAGWYLDKALWRHTELKKTWKLSSARFRTRAAIDGGVAVEYEHVVRREHLKRWLLEGAARWLDNPRELDDLMSLAVTCVVTETEHDGLGRGLGWERYVNARTGNGRIEVVDCLAGPSEVLLDLESAAAAQRTICANLGLAI